MTEKSVDKSHSKNTEVLTPLKEAFDHIAAKLEAAGFIEQPPKPSDPRKLTATFVSRPKAKV